MDSTLDRQLELFRLEAPPDAAMSLLGVYGITNPMIVYLLNRRPDLLAETPAEWRADVYGDLLAAGIIDGGPRCMFPGEAHWAKVAGYRAAIIEPCPRRMHWTYHDNRPAWYCAGDEAPYNHAPYFVPVPRPAPKLNQMPDFDLFAMLGAALKGHSADLVYDLGAWRLKE